MHRKYDNDGDESKKNCVAEQLFCLFSRQFMASRCSQKLHSSQLNSLGIKCVSDSSMYIGFFMTFWRHCCNRSQDLWCYFVRKCTFCTQSISLFKPRPFIQCQLSFARARHMIKNRFKWFSRILLCRDACGQCLFLKKGVCFEIFNPESCFAHEHFWRNRVFQVNCAHLFLASTFAQLAMLSQIISFTKIVTRFYRFFFIITNLPSIFKLVLCS